MKTVTDTALESFTMAMAAKLARHQKERGDSWESCDTRYLLARLCEEYKEFIESEGKTINLTPSYDRKELVDIANFCMMLWYRDWVDQYTDTFQRMVNRDMR